MSGHKRIQNPLPVTMATAHTSLEAVSTFIWRAWFQRELLSGRETPKKNERERERERCYCMDSYSTSGFVLFLMYAYRTLVELF